MKIACLSYLNKAPALSAATEPEIFQINSNSLVIFITCDNKKKIARYSHSWEIDG